MVDEITKAVYRTSIMDDITKARYAAEKGLPNVTQYHLKFAKHHINEAELHEEFPETNLKEIQRQATDNSPDRYTTSLQQQ